MLPDLVLLDVELYGRVVRHERGWRAQRQRVLGVRFVRGCPDCQCLTDAPLLVTVPAPIGDRGWMVTPRCRRCAAIWRSPSSGWPIAPAQLAGLLGTEVCWADETTTAEVMRREAARKGRRRGGVRPHQ